MAHNDWLIGYMDHNDYDSLRGGGERFCDILQHQFTGLRIEYGGRSAILIVDTLLPLLAIDKDDLRASFELLNIIIIL